jgi:hypothetical protein
MAHPNEANIPDSEMIKFAWSELLFGRFGLQFFDKRQLVEEIRRGDHSLELARVWDQAHVIQWLRTHAQFESKGIVTELLPAVRQGVAVTTPQRTVGKDWNNDWRSSLENDAIQTAGAKFERRKLKQATISGGELDRFRSFFNHLKKVDSTEK